MLAESAYPNDTRVRNEANTLVNAGYEVSVIALRRYKHESLVNEINRVKVYRIPELTLFKKNIRSKSWFWVLLYRVAFVFGYMFEYLYFTFACLIVSLYLAFKENFDAIH